MKESDIMGVLDVPLPRRRPPKPSPHTLTLRSAAGALDRVRTKINSGKTSMSSKEVKFGVDARDKMLRGVDILNNAVKVTLAQGPHVVLEKSFGAPRITKDGVTVAKEIELEDKFENMGAQMVREVASKSADAAAMAPPPQPCSRLRSFVKAPSRLPPA